MSVMRVVLDSLRDAKVRWLVLLGVLGLTAGGLLLTAAAAQAVTGSGPGQLALNPPSGATTLTPTWSTTTACPAGFQTSAVLAVLTPAGAFASFISPTVANVTAPFSGTLQSNVAGIMGFLSGANVPNGGTTEWVVECFTAAGGTGTGTFVQAEWVTLSANGSAYTTSNTPPTSPTPTGTPTPTPTGTPSPTPAGTPTPTPAGTPTPTPTGTPTPTPTGTPTPTPTGTPTPTPTSTMTDTGTPAPSPTPSSTGFPSGAPGTGGGRAALSGDGNNVLHGLGAAALAGSVAAMGLAFRRARRLPGENGPGRGKPGGN